MGTFLLLLLGGISAAAALWAAAGKKGDSRPPFYNLEKETQGKSALPVGAERDAFEKAEKAARGEPVALGGSEGVQRLKKLLEKAPARVMAKVFPEKGGEAKKGGLGIKTPSVKRKPLKITHTTDDIIARSSKYAHHRRALGNAENLIEKGKAEEAREIFERAKSRIDNEEIRRKIDQNIEDINRWLAGVDADEDEPITFPEIVVPLTIQAIAIENLTEGLKDVSKEIATNISGALASTAESLASQLKLGIPPPVPGRGEMAADGADDSLERDWDKLRDIPIENRRSGDERRETTDRRMDSDTDRRDGKDRRQFDLLKDRDALLDRLKSYKVRQKEAMDQSADGETGPPGTVPSGAVPSGAVPSGAVPSGAVPSGAVPEGAIERKEEIISPPLAVRMAPPEPMDPIALPQAENLTGLGAAAEAGEAGLGEGVEAMDDLEPLDDAEEPEEKEAGKPQEIHGVLELKAPEEDDAPFLTLTYDFTKIPDSYQLSRDYNTMEYAYYKYKPMLMKAQEFTRRKMLKNALNYYRVIKSQNIPPEFRRMINRNIQDISEYLEKYLLSRS